MASPDSGNEPAGETSFTEAMLGKELTRHPALERWRRLSSDWRVLAAAAIFSALVFLPYLGAVGLWDPWETHYGEVAREMIQRNDYVHPYWENAWFFSKPAFTMWMQAVGMQVAGTLRKAGSLGLYTEWGMRVPFALFSILSVALLALALGRTVSRRAGLAVAFVLPTMPLFFLISRQAVTDTPMISALVAALACAMIAQFDPKTPNRAAWWYGFYVFCAIGMLAKGLLGVGIPAVVIALYVLLCRVPWDSQSVEAHLRWLSSSAERAAVKEGKRPMPALWAQFINMRLLSGMALWAVIALPWYTRMFLFEGVDDESKLFWYRFLIHDHLNRLGAGVHTTTPGGSFTYFIEQGGYAIFPWVALLPGAMTIVGRLRLRSKEPADQVAVFSVIWLALTFGLIGASATKFHHYVLPMLPPLAVLLALFIDRLWAEGIERHAAGLLLGIPLFALVGKDLASNPKDFTDLFVYNYERPYPVELVQQPLSLSGGRPLWMGDLLAVALLGVGGYLAIDVFSAKDRSPWARGMALFMVLLGGSVLLTTATRGRVAPTLFIGLALGLWALYMAYEGTKAGATARGGLLGAAILVALPALALVGTSLSSTKTDRLLPLLIETVNLKQALGFAFVTAGAVCSIALLARAKVMLFTTFWAFACAFALWFNWGHWVDLSHHWTQRDLFWRYYDQRQEAEPIAAFLMNWRGETFYSRNTVKQIKDNGKLADYAKQPGREWALVEQARVGILKQAVGADKTVTLIDRDLNNKFVLVTID